MTREELLNQTLDEISDLSKYLENFNGTTVNKIESLEYNPYLRTNERSILRGYIANLKLRLSMLERSI